MKRVALIIPIHPPYYKYADIFLNSLKTYSLHEECDIYFVFTTNEDCKLFNNIFNNYGYYHTINLENIYGMDIIKKYLNSSGGIITYKKYCGIKELYKKYDYLYVSDCEICAINKVNLLHFAQQFEQKKYFLSTQTVNLDKFIISPSKFFLTKKIKNIIDQKLYIWFNNLPCYISSTIEDFFNTINFNPFEKQFVYEDFDYILYSYYMVEKQNFIYKIIQNIKPNVSLLESFPYINDEKYYSIISQISKEYRDDILWVPYNERFINEFSNACLCFHLNLTKKI